MRITALFLLALGLACWHSLANPPLFITVLYTACTNQIALKDTWPLVSHCTLRCPIGIAARTRSVRGIASTPLADALGLYKLYLFPHALPTFQSYPAAFATLHRARGSFTAHCHWWRARKILLCRCAASLGARTRR